MFMVYGTKRTKLIIRLYIYIYIYNSFIKPCFLIEKKMLYDRYYCVCIYLCLQEIYSAILTILPIAIVVP